MIKQPNISGQRSVDKTLFTITLLNWEEGDDWNVYMGDWLGQTSKVVTDHPTASLAIPDLDPEGNYIFYVTLNNAPLSQSLMLISDHTDEEEPYVVVEPVGLSDIVVSTATFEAPWLEQDLIDVPVSDLTNARIEGNESSPRTTFGKNQTL